MKKYVLLGMAGIAFAGALAAQEETGGLTERYRATANKLIEAALADHAGMEKLTYLCDRIGNRLSGSPALEKAIVWAAAQMKADGLVNVVTPPRESSALGARQRKRRRGGAGEPAADDSGSRWQHRDAEERHHGAEWWRFPASRSWKNWAAPESKARSFSSTFRTKATTAR